MAIRTTTIGPTITAFGSRVAESELARPLGSFDFALLYRAYRACRRGKRGTRKAQRYEIRLLDNLVETARLLRSRHWRPSRAIRFVVRHPKPREILAAEFGDRVVHHVLVPWFERLYEPVFIHDSFANRRGKGTHAAVRRLRGYLRSATDTAAASGSGAGPSYLQLDVANFFNSINRRKLFGLLRDRVTRDMRRKPGHPRHVAPEEGERMLWLARVLLTGNPAKTAVFQGKPEDAALVPAHKQLLNAPEETGLPIGNLTSQFFANVYLNQMDQFVKHTLKCRHYVRYVDDFVLIGQDREQLAAWREAIAAFLRDNLNLDLRDAGRLAPVSDGIDFLGYIVRPDYILVRRRVTGHMHERLARFGRMACLENGMLHLPPGLADAVQATLASYLGHLRHAQAARQAHEAFQRHPWLVHLLCLPHPVSFRLLRRDRPPSVTSLASQWRYFHKRYPGRVALLQVGNRVEVYGWDKTDLPLTTQADTIQRTGLGHGLTWPMRRAATLRKELHRRDIPFCQINEDGWLRGGMKRRTLTWAFPAVAGLPYILRPSPHTALSGNQSCHPSGVWNTVCAVPGNKDATPTGFGKRCVPCRATKMPPLRGLRNSADQRCYKDATPTGFTE